MEGKCIYSLKTALTNKYGIFVFGHAIWDINV